MQSCFPQERVGQFTHGPTNTMLLMENFFHLSFPLILLSLSNSPNPDYLWGCYPAVLGMDPEKSFLFYQQDDGSQPCLSPKPSTHSSHAHMPPCTAVPPHSSSDHFSSFYSTSSFPSFCQASPPAAAICHAPNSLFGSSYFLPTPIHCIYYAVLPRSHPPIF